MSRGPGEERVALNSHEQRQFELIQRNLEPVGIPDGEGTTGSPPSPVRITLLLGCCVALLVGLSTDSVFFLLLIVAAAVLFGLDIPEPSQDTRFALRCERSELLRSRLAMLVGWCCVVLVGLTTGSVVIVLLVLATTVVFGVHLHRRHHQARR